LCEIAHGDEADVDLASKPRAGAFDTVWGKMPGRSVENISFASARILQEKSRELAVLESMDGGKPIKESRDFDVPMAARRISFITAAGRTSWLTHFPAKTPRRSAWRGRSFPWNFPLLMAAWKIAPRAGLRKYRGAEAVQIHQHPPRCAWPPFFRKPACRRRRELCDRRCRDRNPPSTTIPTSLRLLQPARPRWQSHRQGLRGHREEADAGIGWKSGQHSSFEDAPLDQAV